MNRIFNNWDMVRVIRTIIGISIIGQGIASNQTAVWLMGTAFTSMAVFNVGCFGSGNCAVNTKAPQNAQNNTDDLIFEEVLPKQ
jgi:hypothetical protein